ncbi:hypothetical protein [Pseudomonas baetica]|uniref:hypothetical protein n=1 Tax=Pseudomonas baetica TaxID=674054 RepID=UPI002871958A|nr:hypothetical protein [Pseudomonas baetica]MDR9863939.1 hypothetical protein [Pseudomonas baetica]
MNSPITNAESVSNQTVVFPPDPGIGVLAVPPPLVINYKAQDDGAHGVNIAMVSGDRSGLLVYILAYLNMAIGDGIRVFIDQGIPAAEFSVTEAHFKADGTAKNIPFYITAAVMKAKFEPLKKQNKAFWVEVTRVSGNTPEDSAHAQLFYKYPAPGEPDSDAGMPSNQGLKLPVASESVVDQTVIDEGMFVTVLAYFNQLIGDIVVLAFGSLLLETEVTELGDVIFELTPEQLATLAPTNSLVVRYEVFDVVENPSGWSDPLILPFKPGVVLLSAPIFEQADADNVVNYEMLKDAFMNILVTGVFAKGDQIELLLAAFTKSGEPVTHTYRQTFNVASRAVTFKVENERVRNLIGGSVRASYSQIKTGKTQLSKPADVTVSGTALPLGLPIIEPLEDGKLPVDTLRATVKVADYWPLKKGAKVELRWQTSDQDNIGVLFIFRLIVTDPTQPIIFTVQAQYIAPYANKPLFLQNTITNPGEVEVVSQLRVLKFGEETTIDLLPPLLVDATSPVDAITYRNGVTLRIHYPRARAGDLAQPVDVDSPAQQFPLAQFDRDNNADIKLSSAFLAARHGRAIRFLWRLHRAGEQVGESPAATFTVLPISPVDSRLPQATIREANGSVIDLSRFTGNATYWLGPWPWIEVGQLVNAFLLTATGQSIAVLQNHSVTASDTINGLSQSITRVPLQSLPNNTTVTLKTSVSNRALPSNPVHLRDSVYTVRRPSFTAHENFDSTPLIYFQTGQPYTLPSGIILTNLGGITFITSSHLLPGQHHTPLLGSRTLNMLGSVRFTFPSPATSVSFLIDSHQLQENDAVIYRDEAGNIIARRPLPYTNSFQHAYVSYTSSHANIISVEFTNHNDIFVDALYAS